MHFPMPNHPCDFELPDAWLAEAGLAGFRPSRPTYNSTAAAVLVPLQEIEPPYRGPDTPKDWRGFDRVRLVKVLQGFVAGAKIEPVPLRELPEGDFVNPRPYRYRVRDGYHRFYGSIAAGFESLPGVIR